MRIGCFQTHPASDVFPLMSDDDIAELAEDIRRNGLRSPIVLLEGRVLDGRNRLLACLRSGSAPTFDHWRGEGSPVTWLVSMNLHRRHLDTSQRAMIAARALAVFEADARTRQGRRTDLGAELSEGARGKASEKAAALVNVAPRTIEHAKKVLRNGSQELVEKVDRGTLSVSAAAGLCRAATGDLGDGGRPSSGARDVDTASDARMASRRRIVSFDVIASFPRWSDDGPQNIRPGEVKTVAAPDAVLLLHTPARCLTGALRFLRRCGFTFASTVVVTNTPPETGRFLCNTHQFVVLGTRGTGSSVRPLDRHRSSVIDVSGKDDRGRHDAVLAMIDEMFPHARKIELPKRSARTRWHADAALPA